MKLWVVQQSMQQMILGVGNMTQVITIRLSRFFLGLSRFFRVTISSISVSRSKPWLPQFLLRLCNSSYFMMGPPVPLTSPLIPSSLRKKK
jgi:hypothetical protein